MSDEQQSEQDKWMSHPSVGVIVSGKTKKVARAAFTGLQLSIPVKVPEAEYLYVTLGGTVSYVVVCKPVEGEGDDPNIEIKIKNGQAEIEAKLAQKYGAFKISEGIAASGKEGSLGVDVELVDAATKAKTTVAFHLAKVDTEKAEIEFLAFEWTQTYPLVRRTIDAVGMKLEVEGRIDVKLVIQPSKKRIALDILKKLGLAVAEDAALGAAAGGTGATGAAAVAAAPVAGVLGGIAGGIVLCGATMKAIQALGEQGRDSTACAQEGARKLRAYADSYAATVRGRSGASAEGNQDGEAHLQFIMRTAKTTRDDAVAMCNESDQKYEQIAWAALRPKMREAVKRAYDKLHWGGINNPSLLEYLGDNTNY
ncbi:MAG: hypothetical protein ABI281_05940 [Caldimonas sp.]